MTAMQRSLGFQPFQLLLNGSEFFPAMLAAIERAERFIYLELYLVESGDLTDTFIDKLSQAVQRGVYVYCLFDAIGSLLLRNRDRDRLREQGVRLAFYNEPNRKHPFRMLHRDHRKIMVVDGVEGFTGGAGLADEFSPLHRPQRFWRETMVRVRHDVVREMAYLFEQSWRETTGDTLRFAASINPISHPADLVRLSASRGLGQQHIKRSMLKRIRGGKDRIWIATAYFYPSQKLRRALKQAAKRNLDVKLLVPGRYTDHPAVRDAGRHYYQRLLGNGVEIYEYEPRFLHTKCMLCDEWVSIGSCNFDRWNQRWNLEANLEVRDDAFTRAVELMFLTDLSKSSRIDPKRWHKRPLWSRARSWFWSHTWSWVERWMDRNLPPTLIDRQR